MRVFAVIAFVVLALWMGTPFVMAHLVPDAPMRGPTGDLYGAVNALFSGLAFAGLVSTLWLQRQQLDMQREELRLQREELAAQRAEMVASRGEMEAQTRVQHAQVLATSAQLRIAAQQAQMEALAMRAEGNIPDSPFRDQIEGQAMNLAKEMLIFASEANKTIDEAIIGEQKTMAVAVK